MRDFGILDGINCVIYVSDIDTYDLIYINAKGREAVGFEKGEICHGKCYQILQGRETPCNFCNNEKLCSLGTMNWKHQREDGRIYMIKDTTFVEDNHNLRLETAIDITEMEEESKKTKISFEKEHELRKCIEKLVASTDIEESLQHVLKSLLAYYDGSRGYIFELSQDGKIVSNTYEECARQAQPEIQNLQNIPVEYMKFWTDNFEKYGYIQIEDVEALKDDPQRADEYQTLLPQGINNLLVVPLVFDKKNQGFVGVDNPLCHKADISFLRSLTYFISMELEKNRMTKHLIRLSYYDYLTNFNNRNLYNDFIDKSKKKILQDVGVAFLDMNGLKKINDTYGHLYGDKAISDLARIVSVFFSRKEVYRISGDEFVIIHVGSKRQDFAQKMESMKDSLKHEGIVLASTGYVWENSANDLKNMIHRAEQIMYVNKQVYYRSITDGTSKHFPKTLSKLLHDIEDNRYLLYLQPKSHLGNDEIFGAEALVRYLDDDNRIIMPYEFINLLEREKLISNIDFMILRKTCELLSEWRDKGYHKMVISVNMSRVTIAESNFVEKVLSICDSNEVCHDQIEIEITESTETIDKFELKEVIRKLKEAGFWISLDDMGTEYSTLRLLTLKGIDIVKLDRSFLQTIEDDEEGRILMQHMIELCHALNKHCIAEGVETEGQYELIGNMQCDSMQGFILDKPIPVEQFVKKYLEPEK